MHNRNDTDTVDPWEVLRALRRHPMVELTATDVELSGADGLDALGELRLQLDQALAHAPPPHGFEAPFLATRVELEVLPANTDDERAEIARRLDASGFAFARVVAYASEADARADVGGVFTDARIYPAAD